MSKKIIIPAVIGALTGAMVVSPIAGQVAAADLLNSNSFNNVWGADISIAGLKETATVGEVYDIPAVNSDQVLKIYNPYGALVYDSKTSTGDFKPAIKGYYTVKIATVNADGTMKTESNAIKFYANGADYTISMRDNSKYNLPTVVPKNQKLYIPVPNILDEDGEVFDFAGKENFEITASVKCEKDSTSTNLTLADNKEYFILEGTQTEKTGTYDVVYTFKNNETVYDTLTTKFVVKNDFKLNDVKLNFRYSTAKPTTATLGEELTLPKIEIYNDAEGAGKASIAGYADIQVLYYNGTSNTPEDLSSQVKDYKFTPEKQGDYVIKYTARAFYNGTGYDLNSEVATFRINDVKDNKAPRPYATRNYEYNKETDKFESIVGVSEEKLAEINAMPLKEKNEELIKVLGDASTEVPSIVVTNGQQTEVTLPAIFATDNVNALKDLTLKVEYKDGNGAWRAAENVVAGKPVKFKVSGKAANYTVRYVAIDKKDNESVYSNDTLLSFDLKVVESLTDAEKENAPSVVFDSIRKTIKTTETLTFNPATATDNLDSRPTVKTEYGYSANGAEPTSYTELLSVNKDGKYEIDLQNSNMPADATELYIKVTATNDYTNKETVVKRKVSIINVENDEKAPKFATDVTQMRTSFGNVNGATFDEKGLVGGKEFFNQTTQNEVKLPTFAIFDEEDANAQVSVTVKNPYGEAVTLESAIKSQLTTAADADLTGIFTNPGTGNLYKVSGGSFTADYNGVYTVTYTIKDAANNLSIRTFGVVVGDTKAPDGIYPVNTKVFTETQELGKFIEVPEAYIIDNGVRQDVNVSEDGAKTWWVVDGPGVSALNPDGFVATAVGEYKVTYYGQDAAGNQTESAEKIITVDDTIKPVITLEQGYPFPETAIFDNENKDKDDANLITIPGAIVTDEHTDGTIENYTTLSVKVTNKNGDEVTLTKVNKNGEEIIGDTILDTEVVRYRFKATENGNYTVTYIARDKKGNTTELVKTVAVGDTTAPELTWKDGEYDKLIKKEYKINDVITVKINDLFNFEDNYEIKDDYVRKNAKVYLLDPSSSIMKEISEVENGVYRWELEKEGNYTLRVIIKDEAGNTSDPYNFTITVKDNKVDPTTISPVVGTILIVVAVLALAGVVIYFVVTSRKNKGSSKPKKK